MPKLKENQVPAYRRHKQSGHAIVTLSGRDHLLGKFNSTESRAKYDRLIGEWLSNGRRADYRNVEGICVSRLIVEFWAHAKRYYVLPGGEVSSEQENFRQALIPLKRLYGGTPAAEFGPRALKAVQQEMVRMGWCRTHINRQNARLKHLFKWAVGAELIPGSVHHALSAVSGLRKGKSDATESAPVRPVPEEFVYPLKDQVSRQVWAMIELQLLTGMRSGEVVIMRGCDLERGEKVWIYRPHRHKTQHHDIERDVRIGPKAQRILEPFLKLDLQAYLFSPIDAERERREALRAKREKSGTPLSCGNTIGSNRLARPARKPDIRYTVTSYRRAIARGCDDAFPPPAELAPLRVPGEGRKMNSKRWETPAEWEARLGDEKWADVLRWREEHRWHPHQLRHNAATRLRRDYGIEAARIILGHQSAAITQIYAEADVQKATQIMGEVG